MRLLHVGNTVVDLVLPVTELPGPGGDVPAASSRLVAGGGMNVMLAALRQGLPVTYAGAHGTGPMGDLVRNTLREHGIHTLQPVSPGLDTGLVVTLVQPDGERSFVTTVGAEGRLDGIALARVDVSEADLVYASGYGLIRHPGASERAAWLSGLPDSICVFVDPGPLGVQMTDSIRDAVLARADWWSANASEATALTGCPDPVEAARALGAVTGRRGVLVRTGASGCLLLVKGSGKADSVLAVGAPTVRVVDTTGAGDVHAGVFLASVAQGFDPLAAARRATVAAALSVTRLGPDAAPTSAELEAFLTLDSASPGTDSAQ
jgi:sugar/nucleoside kinase (ribokinase family)